MSDTLHIPIGRDVPQRPPAWALAWYRGRVWYTDMIACLHHAILDSNTSDLSSDELRAFSAKFIKGYIDRNYITEIDVIGVSIVLNIPVTPEITMMILQGEVK